MLANSIITLYKLCLHDIRIFPKKGVITITQVQKVFPFTCTYVKLNCTCKNCFMVLKSSSAEPESSQYCAGDSESIKELDLVKQEYLAAWLLS